MNQFRTVSTILFSLLGIGLGFVVFGWWAVLIVVGAVVWQVANARLQPASHSHITHTSSIAIQPSKPAPTVTWQETVDAIEKQRAGEAGGIPESSLTGHPLVRHDSMPPGLLIEHFEDIGPWAHIDPWPLIHRAREIVASIDAGDPRKTEMIVRECCPAAAWDWPQATAFLQSINKRATCFQFAELVAHRLTRLHMLLRRHEQMLQNTHSRPYWQLRPVNDSLTQSECLALQHQVMRFDSPFWEAQGPLHCEHVFCRCSISALNERDVQRHVALRER